MAVLVELPDDSFRYVIKGMEAEIARLHDLLAQRPRPSANYRDSWTPERRRRMSITQKACWVRRRAKAAATASANIPYVTGNGHDTEAWL